MATENTEPKTRLIIKVGAVSVITLIAVRAGLVAYYDNAAQAEEQRKLGDAKPEALMSLRAQEQERLNSGPMPIDKAKEELAAKGRMGASSMIVPSISRDLAPLQGWSKMPEQPPAAMTPPPEASEIDAGPSTVVDASAVRGARPDAAGPRAATPAKPPIPAKHP